MMSLPMLLRLVTLASPALAAYQGFNYGNTFSDGRLKRQADFEAEFVAARTLVGTSGFTSARLYTSIQGGTANAPIEAIQAAINTETTLLLGLWASAGDEVMNNEIAALRNAVNQFGERFCSLVAGISVGSEDLYRNSPQGIAAGSYVGAEPAKIAEYITRTRQSLADTCLARAPIGHVDTWTAWVNNSNQAVINGCDWIGMDAYPYFEETHANAIAAGAQLFNDALGKTQAAVAGKPVWITETGWPVSGKTVGAAVPSLQNAKAFWNDVGCPMFGRVNVWWYTFQDANPVTPNPSFGIVGSQLSNQPLFDLSCSSPSTPNGPAPPFQEPNPSSDGSVPSSTGIASPGPGAGSPGIGGPPKPASSTSPDSTGTGTGSQTPSTTGNSGDGSTAAPPGVGGTAAGGGGSSTSQPEAPTSAAGNDAGVVAGRGGSAASLAAVGVILAAVVVL